MTRTSRFAARVVTRSVPKTRHYRGWPPQLTGGSDSRELMEPAALLVIEHKPDGVFLYRFTADRRCVGDTWHETLDAAKQQAAFEFDHLLSDWKEVPGDLVDAVSFGLAEDL